jgi:hypothetical protein
MHKMFVLECCISGYFDLPFGLAQGGSESFDSAQDREPVDRLVERFEFGLYYFQ